MRANVIIGIVIVLALAAGGATLRAEGGCREACERGLAECKKACADAPVVDECKANCQIGFDACLATCS